MVIGGVKSIFARNLCVVFVFSLNFAVSSHMMTRTSSGHGPTSHPFMWPFTLICQPQNLYRRQTARFLGVDSLWDILCNHLPEGSELGGCNWTDSLNILHENLTLPTLRAEDGDWWSQVHLCPELVRGVCLLSLNFKCPPHDDFVFQFGTWTHKIS